ncbi:hypothetical protein OPV22_000149 [Ensete ventricosum]|uniref:DUF3511 domain-containing protein n=1 Tax=Ensete ventricosum TaxID=4639 RepID=A0A444G5Z2_ENSVE|nr:hypothetical protein OPV22_000149 [Ensete ventricosum]RRT41519.1 hypothetical protein B296_00053044 [Ensete ventricosum]RWW30305.1 hypothetical protein GW17_00005110 [Ensete ventricosum]RZS05423.1 hypothetical protein BHM03_00035973 [Ensete ventricosum]
MGHRADSLPPLKPRRGSGAISSSSARPWWSSDPEAAQRRRMARYKAYGVESKVRASLRRGLRWLKSRCSYLVHGR